MRDCRLGGRGRGTLGFVAALVWAVAVTRTAAADAWRTYEQCTLIENPYNDGDSFHVRAGGRHYIFRLYFVDAPETSDAFPDRVADQARDFNIAPALVPVAGRRAAAFTAKALARPFRVFTRGQDARGQSRRHRFFAMIETADGRYLSEQLTEAGYARVYGAPAVLPDGTAAHTYVARLRAREREARRARRGAWNLQGAAAATPGAEPGAAVTPRSLVLEKNLAVYDPDTPSRRIGVLVRGARIAVLEAASAERVRIRFVAGKTSREGVCRRADLE